MRRNTRRLRLNSDTVRMLDSAALRNVQGGEQFSVAACPTSLTTICNSCRPTCGPDTGPK